MKSSRNLLSRILVALPVAGLFIAGMVARGDLVDRLQNLEANGRFEVAFFRTVALPGGPLTVRRLPAESRHILDDLVSKSPNDAELYLMRARADEAQLDFTTAEADWQKFAQVANDKVDAQLQLADFYHRRLRPLDEIKALAAAAQAPTSAADKLLPPNQQKAWQTFDRIFEVIRLQALPGALSIEQYNAWIAHYPHEASTYSRYFNFLLSAKKLPEGERLINRYETAFPLDKAFPLEARATLAYKRGSTDEALALYDRSFQPLWPSELIQDYFSLLKETHRWREFLSHARADATANPTDVNAAARLFHYYQQQGNPGEAKRALVDYRSRMETTHATWKGDQLWTLARLFEGIHEYDDAARGYYALYSLPGADPALQEKALAGIANLLLSAPEQPIRFGSNSISFLRDIGAMDPYPGFLNGIVSLLLNSQSPAAQYSQAEAPAVAYFHRARAAELIAVFDQRFPKSGGRSELHARLLDAYALYAMDDAILREGRQFLASYPKASQRVHVGMLMADCYARKNRVKEELALYDSLLNELAARADHVPLGDTSTAQSPTPQTVSDESAPEGGSEATSESPAAGEEQSSHLPIRERLARVRVRGEQRPAGQPRSLEYSQVLERYISRLVALHRPLDVLGLFRREMDHNPNDSGLYERLAAFLEQNNLDDRIEAVYKKAIQQFPDRSWYQKLARWYLRRKSRQQFDDLTRQVVQVFSGTDLQEYFQSVVGGGEVAPQMYLQLNLYAHQRFPHNLAFVTNLLGAYHTRQTYNNREWEALIRQSWFYDDDLRSQYFAYLSRSGRLDSELLAVRGTNPLAAQGKWNEVSQANPAAAQFMAEAELWRSHFESAAPIVKALAEAYPADLDFGRRASSVFRSLAPFNPQYTEVAAGIESTLLKSNPGDRDLLIRIGDIYADREMFAKARPYWNRVPKLEPGNPDADLQSATVFWDYFLFGDTLRVIGDARKKFAKPALFAYEAGAVYEGQRDYSRAVGEYLKGALASGEDSPARSRVLQLAKRSNLRDAIDRATEKAASGADPDGNAVSLRIAVLEALERRADLETFLTRLAQNTSSLELLAAIQPVTDRQGLDNVRILIIERQIALMNDPVEKLQLRLELARFYESKNQMEQARALFAGIYSENPLLLGVVRSAVDFYWRNKMPDPAIDLLLKASKSAYTALGQQFTFEAARKATEVKEYTRARELITALLQQQPFKAEYLAGMADTYAREGDDKSLRDFYVAQIQNLRSANLPPDEKVTRIAALRRGLIPALARLKDFAGAVDQYIEILNKFPEDEGLAQEAAAFADRHDRRKQLSDYYAKATADSPKDYRWPMVLARIQTYFEDYDGAIASYVRARAVRPDRTDLLTAQAGLEERLMRFDDALKSYQRLYQQTYENPEWMEKIAELYAREGQTDAAVTALKKALIDGRPEAPDLYFNAADHLVGWNMLDQARQFAERGASLAGKDLLIRPENVHGAVTYVTLLTRLRDYSTAYTCLMEAAKAARDQKIEPNLNQFLSAMGDAVKEYYTPEERNTFTQFLLKQREGMVTNDFIATLIPLAQYAGLTDLEVRWRLEVMMDSPGSNVAQIMETRLGELQKQRMKFNEYGAQLESYWSESPQRPDKDLLLERAADSYESAGNTSAELRVLQRAFGRQGLDTQHLQRFLDLVSKTSPEQLVTISGEGRGTPIRDAAASSALTTGKSDLALRAIAARGQGLPSVWTRAYTGLVGLYYADVSPAVNSAYQQALDTRNIGDRIAKPPDRDEVLAGNIWFYYGSRFGEYRSVTHQGDPEDYLPAALEGTPASSDPYFTLADYYREAGQLDSALQDYAHALELSPQRGDAHDRMAQVLWQQGKRDQAIKEWSLALKAFKAQEESSSVPPAFWTDLRITLEDIGQHRVLPQLREDADAAIRAYIHTNGSYRVGPLLQGVLAAADDPVQGAEWLVDLSRADSSPLEFLSQLVYARWFPDKQKDPVYQKILALAQDQANKTFGTEHSTAVENLTDWQHRWVDYLLDKHRTADAQAFLKKLPEKFRDPRQPDGAYFMVRLAAQSNQLDQLIQQFQQNPEMAPSLEDLRNDARNLQEEDPASSRRLFEYVYTRQIDEHDFAPANFLGLAEIRLQQADVSQAISLLRRMNRVAGEPFENLGAAGDLLVKMGHPAEAVEFYAMRAKAVPWDSDARVRLAQAEAVGNTQRNDAIILLTAVASSPVANYSTRVSAAESLAALKASAPSLGSAELDGFLRPVVMTAVESPGFFYARIRAAMETSDLDIRIHLLSEAIAIYPEWISQSVGVSPPTDVNPVVVSPRILLFQAAAAADQNQLALSALMPIVDQSILTTPLASPPENGAASEEPQQRGRNSIAAAFLSGQDLDINQKSAIAVQLAEALQKLDRLEEAVRAWNLASILSPDAALRSQAIHRREQIAAQLKIEQADHERRPVITDHLEQQGLVRPRLLGRAGPSASAGAVGGGGQ